MASDVRLANSTLEGREGGQRWRRRRRQRQRQRQRQMSSHMDVHMQRGARPPMSSTRSSARNARLAPCRRVVAFGAAFGFAPLVSHRLGLPLVQTQLLAGMISQASPSHHPIHPIQSIQSNPFNPIHSTQFHLIQSIQYHPSNTIHTIPSIPSNPSNPIHPIQSIQLSYTFHQCIFCCVLALCSVLGVRVTIPYHTYHTIQ